MIEFTISRVALCIGGIVLLAAAVGAVSNSYDTDVHSIDRDLTGKIAMMLDSFESSNMDVLILEGPSILPKDCSISVHDNTVILYTGNLKYTAVTKYSGEFTMDSNETVEVTRRTSRLSS